MIQDFSLDPYFDPYLMAQAIDIATQDNTETVLRMKLDKLYEKYNLDKKKEKICAICLEDIENDGFNETNCNHSFHSNCFFVLLKYSTKCPMCRKELVKKIKP